MKTLTIRGLDDTISQKLKEKAQKNNKSINQTVVDLLKSSLGLDNSKKFKVHHDLDDLAGTWSKEDHSEFNKNTEQFNQVDMVLWK